MADAAPVVHIGENSPEEVAYKLMAIISRNEGFNINSWDKAPKREWIIRTYHQCIQATKANWDADTIVSAYKP